MVNVGVVLPEQSFLKLIYLWVWAAKRTPNIV